MMCSGDLTGEGKGDFMTHLISLKVQPPRHDRIGKLGKRKERIV